mgnify:CR=1 FL=1
MWKTIMKFLAGTIGAFLSQPVVQLLLVLMVADIVVGMLRAIVTSEGLHSDVSYKGMAKKAMALILVGIAYVLQVQAQSVAGLEVPISIGSAVALFYSAHEFISILENAVGAGLPVPELLKSILKRYVDE